MDAATLTNPWVLIEGHTHTTHDNSDDEEEKKEEEEEDEDKDEDGSTGLRGKNTCLQPQKQAAQRRKR